MFYVATIIITIIIKIIIKITTIITIITLLAGPKWVSWCEWWPPLLWGSKGRLPVWPEHQRWWRWWRRRRRRRQWWWWWWWSLPTLTATLCESLPKVSSIVRAATATEYCNNVRLFNMTKHYCITITITFTLNVNNFHHLDYYPKIIVRVATVTAIM